MIYKEIDELPETVDNGFLDDYFNKLINYARNNSDLLRSIDYLEKLADKQWHTYDLLNGDVKEIIELWLEEVWDSNNEKFIASIPLITSSLGLFRTYNLLRKTLAETSNSKIKEELKIFFMQVKEERILDPYFEMKRQFGPKDN